MSHLMSRCWPGVVVGSDWEEGMPIGLVADDGIDWIWVTDFGPAPDAPSGFSAVVDGLAA